MGSSSSKALPADDKDLDKNERYCGLENVCLIITIHDDVTVNSLEIPATATV